MKNRNLIILGGNSKNNILWLDKYKQEFSKDYKVYDIFYEHWENNKEINFDIELNKMNKIATNIKDYNIIAKSIGSVISIIGIDREIIKPKKMVILGYPLDLIKNNNLNINSLIKEISKKINILIIQQDNDPIGKYVDVAKELTNVKVIEIPGNDHSYTNLNIIKILIEEFLNT